MEQKSRSRTQLAECSLINKQEMGDGMKEHLFSRLEHLFPELVRLRREFHMYPELSFNEVATPEKIAEFLHDAGLQVRTGVGERGVIGQLKGEKAGKTVALRADFDALPIQDEKSVEYKSRVPGVMHACGHDVHTAALLGVAKVLSEVKDQLAGEVVFIHQFAEEVIPGGAQAMIADGCLNDVDVIYGAHVTPLLPIGTIGVGEGSMMAASDSFIIDIIGRGGHGASPHLTIDPVVIGSQVVLQLQQIISRGIDPLKPAVITIGSFNSGQGFNIIPESARLTGTVRTLDEQARDVIEHSIRQMTKSICEAAGATAKITYTRGYPVLCNHPCETAGVKQLAQDLVGKEYVQRLSPVMESEDFSSYLQQIPGCFFFVGGGNKEIGAVYPHHHPRFDVDERAILLIGKMFLSIVLREFQMDLAAGAAEIVFTRTGE